MSEAFDDECPQGFVFPGLRDESKRGPLLGLLSVVLIAGLALIWPIYPLVRGIHPYILGLPLPFAWVVGWLVIVFVALVLYYRTDRSEDTD